MKSFPIFFIILLLISPIAYSVAGNPGAIKNNEVVVQVHGVVCSFCAYGVQKNLSKLKFIDRSKYKDGILVDINTHQVTLAIKDGQNINIQKIVQAILKGGYEPVKMYLNIKGKVNREGNKYILTSNKGHKYILNGKKLEQLLGHNQASIKGYIDSKHLNQKSPPFVVTVQK